MLRSREVVTKPKSWHFPHWPSLNGKPFHYVFPTTFIKFNGEDGSPMIKRPFNLC